MSEPLELAVIEPPGFFLAESPCQRVLRRLHLIGPNGRPRAWTIALIAWVPLCIGGVIDLITHGRLSPILLDISTHTRFLIAIPILFTAEHTLALRARASSGQLYHGRFAPHAMLDRILEDAERARDSRIVELIFFVAAFGWGQLVLWSMFGATGLFSGVEDAQMSFTRFWYAAVALPIPLFLGLRWLWHWAIWQSIVVRASRLPLKAIATHPDRGGGLGFLSTPISSFGGFTFAISSVLAGAWLTQIIAGNATMQTFIPSFLVFVVAAELLACGAMLAYVDLLYSTRHREIGAYTRLGLEFVRAFDRRWVGQLRTANELVGTPDYQSLNDLGGSYATLLSCRLVPMGPRPAFSVWMAAAIPMLPLVATTMPLAELLSTIGRALLGGVPR
jgi:hypothetical protein